MRLGYFGEGKVAINHKILDTYPEADAHGKYRNYYQTSSYCRTHVVAFEMVSQEGKLLVMASGMFTPE